MAPGLTPDIASHNETSRTAVMACGDHHAATSMTNLTVGTHDTGASASRTSPPAMRHRRMGRATISLRIPLIPVSRTRVNKPKQRSPHFVTPGLRVSDPWVARW